MTFAFTARSARTQAATPSFDDTYRPALIDAVQAADGRKYAGMNIYQHRRRRASAGLRRTGFNGLLDKRADIAAQHQ